ncbi:MAG: McrC family protein [Ignavibacterium sp.]|nr:McrC family protein [Ignavibacterium sp.]
MKLKIKLTEFGDKKSIYIDEIRKWFPTGKFDKRYPQEYLTKWIRKNEEYLNFLGINYKWDDLEEKLNLTTGDKAGLAPLKNPYGGNTYGYIVVKPRIGWLQIYDILTLIDWKYQPTFLEDEEEIISDGILPRWFKILDTLQAIDKALSNLMRGISRKEILSSFPVGTVNWTRYASNNFSRGKFDSFDCLISDYSIDHRIHRIFKGIVKIIKNDIERFSIPIKVIQQAQMLLTRIDRVLENVIAEEPSIEKLKRAEIPYFYRTLYGKAIDKCVEFLSQSKFSFETGNFYGLPWSIEMSRLFEYWVEHWAYLFAKRIGAKFYSDIKGNSKIRFYNLKGWKSLNQLKPDIVIEKDSKTLIIDVKYKRHLEYLEHGISNKEIIDDHRGDIHQILSYLSSSTSIKRIGCLIYPKMRENIGSQYAAIINYSNVNINVDLLLCEVSFNYNDVLDTLNEIWTEQYR